MRHSSYFMLKGTVLLATAPFMGTFFTTCGMAGLFSIAAGLLFTALGD